ncbi:MULTISPECIES: hypothetical protein [unclassified Stenotrophomonas]|uniref:hypothetical protein n=1 Tax=unclassified Stenotrophomonas TaxID=196198 RepID=UPI0021198C26|nr:MULTISPECIES: hypothetical protein [unclassified Stenotrophomonas]
MVRLYALFAVAALALSFWAGWAWRGDQAAIIAGTAEVADWRKALVGEQLARSVDHEQVRDVQQAEDSADKREERLNGEYQERVAAAVAGRDSELGRLRSHWASCETNRLADGAAASAEAAEQDRLRRVGAAGIVRSCELAQSERDEAVDRYRAVETAINGAPHP